MVMMMMMIKSPEIAFRRVLPLLVRLPSLVSRQGQIKTISFRTITTKTLILTNSNSRFSPSISDRNFSIRASQVNDSGSIDSPLILSMQNKIKEQLNAQSVTVKDAYGDGRHVSIDVVSSSFEGQSAVNRQRMVYKAIWEELQNTVHAVDQMTTKTPTEAGAADNS